MDAVEGNVEEFDSSDDESESAQYGKKVPPTSVDVSSQGTACIPNEDIAPAGNYSDNRISLSLNTSSESRLNDNNIPLKEITIPTVAKDNIEVTSLCGQENFDETSLLKSAEFEFENAKKKDNLRPEEHDANQEERGIDDKFGLDRETITHQQLMDLTKKGIASLIESDPLLSDLPSDVTLEEINSQIALVQGQSISVMIAASQPAKLVVAQEGTVLDLKRSLQRHTALRLARQGRSKVKVNWRYFWRTHWLVQPGGNRLTRNSDKLKDLGIVNKSVLTYCKRLHERQR